MAIIRQKIITGEYWHPQDHKIVGSRLITTYALYESQAAFEAGIGRPISYEKYVSVSPDVIQAIVALKQAHETEVLTSGGKLGGGIAVPDSTRTVSPVAEVPVNG